MPKETVNDVVAGYKAIVGWTKDREVQVATVAPGFPRVTEDSTDEHNGWHVTLDREGCNRLIRALRKARDQAYGSDA